MRRILTRGRSQSHGYGATTTEDRRWRQVPKINLLPRRRRTAPTKLIIRSALVLILIVEVLWVQDRARDGGAPAAADAQSNARMKSQLQATQREVAQAQEETGALQTEFTALKQQRDAKDQASKQATAGHLNWNAALRALFLAQEQVSGVQFSLVADEPEGVVVLQGFAKDLKTMAELQNQLMGVAAILDLLSIQWETVPNALKFTANFKVRE